MTADWLNEKSRHIISSACYHLVHVRETKSDMPEDIYDPIYQIMFNATKIFCSSLGEMYDDSKNRWSPELVDYLFAHPQECEKTLRIVASKEYADQYYDEDFKRLFQPRD
jgi:hypothetical protein